MPDASNPDIVAGGRGDRWWDERVTSAAGGRPGRVALTTARRHPRVTAVLVAAVLGLGVTVAAAAGRDGPEPVEAPAMALGEACTRLVAYRDADSGREWLAAREDLRGVVHLLPTDGTSQRAVRTYADATLGPPTAGPARYLVAADRACRGIGRPLLPPW